MQAKIGDNSNLKNGTMRWQAVVQRDKTADGKFFYGVVTTGIYCRPSCASRIPRRENVRFFDTQVAAESAGFRPCRRCRPNHELSHDTQKSVVIRACEIIKTSDQPPSLAELAAEVGLSPYYFHRLFKLYVGVTPKQYAMEERTRRMRAQLQGCASVTQAIYDTGFSSSSRFYEQSESTLGMKPARYRNGGEGSRISYAVSPCYLGWVLVAATSKGVCAIEFGDSKAALESNIGGRFPGALLDANDAAFTRMVKQVINYLDLPNEQLDIPLDVQGTAFQRRVWQALRQIPSGETLTYGQVAKQIGKPSAARAVAQACASNKIAVAIPCHRVVRNDGGLGGYRWGIERKRALLKREEENRSADKKLSPDG